MGWRNKERIIAHPFIFLGATNFFKSKFSASPLTIAKGSSANKNHNKNAAYVYILKSFKMPKTNLNKSKSSYK